MAAIVTDGTQEGALAQVQRALDAAAANTASIPSAVGDATMEERDMFLTEEKVVTRREQAEVVAAEVSAGQRKSMFSASEVSEAAERCESASLLSCQEWQSVRPL